MPSQPLSARTPSAPLGKAPRGPRRDAGKKKRAMRRNRAAYVVAGMTVLVMAGATAWLSAHLWERWFPAPAQGARSGDAVRLSVPAVYDSEVPARKGLVVMAPDQIYRKQVLDAASIARRESVERLCAKGVLTVFGDGAFHGTEPVTRAEYMTWLYNAWLAQTERGEDPFVPVKQAPVVVSGTPDMFDDVDPAHWAFEVLSTLKGNRLLMDRACRPDAVLRREEWATLSRMVMQPVATRESEKNPDAQQLDRVLKNFSFNDAAAIAPEHAPAVYWLLQQEKYATGITQTFEIPVKAGPWKPQAPVTRMEAAVWIDEVFDDIGRAL